MKKYKYKLKAYTFKVSRDLAMNIERTLNKEGAEGWELVNWQLCPEPSDTISLIQSTKRLLNVLVTWKREINETK